MSDRSGLDLRTKIELEALLLMARGLPHAAAVVADLIDPPRQPGQRSRLDAVRRARRDHLIRRIAEHFADELSAAARARCTHQAIARYRASAWQHERTLDLPPTWREGKPSWIVWHLLVERDAAPSLRTVRRALEA